MSLTKLAKIFEEHEDARDKRTGEPKAISARAQKLVHLLCHSEPNDKKTYLTVREAARRAGFGEKDEGRSHAYRELRKPEVFAAYLREVQALIAYGLHESVLEMMHIIRHSRSDRAKIEAITRLQDLVFRMGEMGDALDGGRAISINIGLSVQQGVLPDARHEGVITNPLVDGDKKGIGTTERGDMGPIGTMIEHTPGEVVSGTITQGSDRATERVAVEYKRDGTQSGEPDGQGGSPDTGGGVGENHPPLTISPDEGTHDAAAEPMTIRFGRRRFGGDG